MTTLNAPILPPTPPSQPNKPPVLTNIILLGAMCVPMLLLAVKGTLPVPSSIIGFKHFIDALSTPELSLPFFFVPIFILMVVNYGWWTQPKVFAPLMLLFTFIYFGAMVIDENYHAILKKPDNVPISIMMFSVIFCCWVAFRQAWQNDSAMALGKPLVVEDKDDKTLVWPDLVYTELLCIVIASAVLVIWACLLPAPLESPANPAGPPNPSKAPWYFLGLQEMLVYYDPWMAGVVLPVMIITGLIAMPFVDTNPKGAGYYTIRQRPFAIFVWLFGFVILWVVLIIYGTFLRGPNWNFFGPFQYWDPHRQDPLTNINLSDYVWIFGMNKSVTSLPMGIRELPGFIFIFIWMLVLPPLLARTVMRRMYQELGGWRYYIMIIHFLVMALLPLKMLLRWMFNLKYFIYLPEINLNL